MLRYLFILTLTVGFLAGAANFSNAAVREGCIPSKCNDAGNCNCSNGKNRGCLAFVCQNVGVICGCGYIANNGNPFGQHIRLTDCLYPNGPVIEEPELVQANCDPKKEIPLVFPDTQCARYCNVAILEE